MSSRTTDVSLFHTPCLSIKNQIIFVSGVITTEMAEASEHMHQTNKDKSRRAIAMQLMAQTKREAKQAQQVSQKAITCFASPPPVPPFPPTWVSIAPQKTTACCMRVAQVFDAAGGTFDTDEKIGNPTFSGS